jgi:hypothetical protein
MELGDVDDEPITYVALLWSFLTVPFSVSPDHTVVSELKDRDGFVTLLDLALEGLIPLLGKERVKINDSGETYLDL